MIMKKNLVNFDKKDLKIIRVLDQRGPDVSTKSLGKMLRIPQRTVRYRISRLRTNKLLQPFRYSTRERRIGLGENIVVLDLSKDDQPFAEDFFGKTPAVGWYASTYGRMNGFLANIVYPLEKPDSNVKVLDSLKNKGIIKDYIISDLFNHITKGWDLSKFNSAGRWIWDWQKWYSQIDSILNSDRQDVTIKTEEESQISFDSKDVLLLRMLHENPAVTQKQLSNGLTIPISQVRKRFLNLKEAGVIIGYKPIFTPFRDTLTLMCVIKSATSISRILACIYELPYSLDIYIESPTKIGVRIRLSTDDIIGFFRGLDRIRHLTDYLAVQILHNIVSFGTLRLYDLYSTTEEKWITHSSEYFDWLENWLR